MDISDNGAAAPTSKEPKWTFGSFKGEGKNKGIFPVKKSC